MTNILRKNRASLGLALLALSLVILSCDRWVVATIKVVDENGTPIPGAEIIFKQGNDAFAEKEADLTGISHFHENVCPMPGCSTDFTVTVSKDGYETTVQKFDADKNYNGSGGYLIVVLKNE